MAKIKAHMKDCIICRSQHTVDYEMMYRDPETDRGQLLYMIEVTESAYDVDVELELLKHMAHGSSSTITKTRERNGDVVYKVKSASGLIYEGMIEHALKAALTDIHETEFAEMAQSIDPTYESKAMKFSNPDFIPDIKAYDDSCLIPRRLFVGINPE